ncbi:hypothetical protein [Kribbella sp. NPDC051718]|uniref:hypothetical protein n=1 Tax=Kribbella sp. NPDC051718 TaxID=3155168 RepID=UPI00343D7030
MATATVIPTVRRSRAGLILALSPIPFVILVITLLVASAAAGTDKSAEITPAVMAEIRAQWIGVWIVYPLAVCFGSVGMLHLFGSRHSVLARGAVVATGLSIVCALVNAGLNLSITGFDADRLGSVTRYDVALEVNLVSFWLAWVALICGGLALRRAGELRRTGLVVAVLAGLFGVVDIAGHGAVPPFVLSFLWLTLGVGLLRSRSVPSEGE